jgi:hypothetical protein
MIYYTANDTARFKDILKIEGEEEKKTITITIGLCKKLLQKPNYIEFE